MACTTTHSQSVSDPFLFLPVTACYRGSCSCESLSCVSLLAVLAGRWMLRGGLTHVHACAHGTLWADMHECMHVQRPNNACSPLLATDMPAGRTSMAGGMLFPAGPGASQSGPGDHPASPAAPWSPGAMHSTYDGLTGVSSPSIGASRAGGCQNLSPAHRESMSGRRRSAFGGPSNLNSARGGPKIFGGLGMQGPRSPAAGGQQGSAHAKYDWIRTSLPPEVAAAHIEHLSTLTEQHIDRYHKEVTSAQARMLAESGLRSAAEAAARTVAERAVAAAAAAEAEQEKYKGLGGQCMVGISEGSVEEEGAAAVPPVLQLPSTANGLLAAGPDALEAALKQHLLGDAAVGDEPEQDIKEVTRQVHSSTSIPELISAALEHVDSMAADLQAFKESMPKEPVKVAPRRARKPSVPLTRLGGSTSAAPSAATTRPPSQAEKAASGDLKGSGELNGSDGSKPDAGVWPQLSSLSLTQRAASLHAAGAVEGGEEGEGEYAEGEGVADIAEGGAHERNASISSPRSLQVSPRQAPAAAAAAAPTAPPTINHTPITAKRLAALEEKIDAACAPAALATLYLPTLPNLPPAPSASLHIQARLERVWNALLVPLTMRLDTVLVYTHRDRAGQLEQALAAWEKAAVTVVAREEALLTLSSLQEGVEEGRVGHLSVSAVERQCITLLQLSALVREAGRVLRDQHGMELTYDGEPYPGVDTLVTKKQIIAFFEWLKDVPSLRLLN